MWNITLTPEGLHIFGGYLMPWIVLKQQSLTISSMSLWHNTQHSQKGCCSRGKCCLFTSVNLNKRAYWGWSSRQPGSSLLVVHVVITCGMIYHSVGGCIQVFLYALPCMSWEKVWMLPYETLCLPTMTDEMQTHTCPGPPVLSAQCCPFSTSAAQVQSFGLSSLLHNEG